MSTCWGRDRLAKTLTMRVKECSIFAFTDSVSILFKQVSVSVQITDICNKIKTTQWFRLKNWGGGDSLLELEESLEPGLSVPCQSRLSRSFYGVLLHRFIQRQTLGKRWIKIASKFQYAPCWFTESIKICSLRTADVISIALWAVIYTSFVLSFVLRAVPELWALKK
jgi:hypothetical protein